MDLKFDKMIVDTTLAQDYMQQEKELSDFCYAGVLNAELFDGQTYSNDMYDIKIIVTYTMVKMLAVQLKENADLFAQLNYLMQKVPIEDSKAQLNVSIQQINYVSSIMSRTDEKNLSVHLTIKSDWPLLALGYVGRMMASSFNSCFAADQTTAPIFHLFAKICHGVGYPVLINFVKNQAVCAGLKFTVPECSTAVVTDHSDVDSAVDILLSSPKRVPWSLRKIFVQESIYQQFKKALAWKCNSEHASSNPTDGSPTSLIYNEREFLLDCVDSNLKPNHVAVEAYRTTKELISLLSELKPHYVSLWANNIEEVNQIAYTITSPIVWVNNFGDFRGPNKTSVAIYSHTPFPNSRYVTQPRIDILNELKKSWLNLHHEDRFDIIVKALVNVKDRLLNVADTFQCGFTDIGKDYVCVEIPTPIKQLMLFEGDLFSTPEVFESILRGDAFFVYDKDAVEFINRLQRAGVPVVFAGDEYSGVNIPIVTTIEAIKIMSQSTKIIKSNLGTTFAN